MSVKKENTFLSEERYAGNGVRRDLGDIDGPDSLIYGNDQPIRWAKAKRRESPKASAIIIDLASIEPEAIDWLWENWLAKSKFHLIAGAPESGKTTIALSIGSAISSGEYWPDQSGKRAPAGNVLIWTSEDGIGDTIKPRMMAMGANLSRVKIVSGQRDPSGKERPFNPATDMVLLIEAVREMPDGVALLILDPVVAAVPVSRNSHNNAETRNGLQPVIDFAVATKCAVIGITHFTKGTAGKEPVERIVGSVAFGALARIVWIASKCVADGEDAPSRMLVRAKSNIGPSGDGFGYDIEAAADSDDVARLKRDNAAQGFLDDVAHRNGMMPPGSRASLADGFLSSAMVSGQALMGCFVRVRRRLSPESSMRCALWTRRSRMASA